MKRRFQVAFVGGTLRELASALNRQRLYLVMYGFFTGHKLFCSNAR